jgi:hypothetical protein
VLRRHFLRFLVVIGSWELDRTAEAFVSGPPCPTQVLSKVGQRGPVSTTVAVLAATLTFGGGGGGGGRSDELAATAGLMHRDGLKPTRAPSPEGAGPAALAALRRRAAASEAAAAPGDWGACAGDGNAADGRGAVRHAALTCLEGRAWRAAVEVLELAHAQRRAQRSGTCPRPLTVAAVHDAEEAWPAEAWEVSFGTYKKVVEALSGAGRVDDALAALAVLAAHREAQTAPTASGDDGGAAPGGGAGAALAGNGHVFALVLNACAADGRMDLAAALRALLPRCGVAPSAVLYAILLKVTPWHFAPVAAPPPREKR